MKNILRFLLTNLATTTIRVVRLTVMISIIATALVTIGFQVIPKTLDFWQSVGLVIFLFAGVVLMRLLDWLTRAMAESGKTQ